MTTCSRPGCTRKPKLIRDGLCRAHAEARGVRRIPVHIVKQHIDDCVESGWQASAVGEAAGVGSCRISHIMNGKCDHVNRPTAERILAIRPRQVSSGWYPATGANRRAQALAASGWTRQQIADTFGVSIDTVSRLFNHRLQSVKIGTHQRIKAAYQRVENMPPNAKVDARIARHGWPTPIAWDGLDMDNPDHYPAHTPAVVDTFDPVLVDRLHHHINLATGNRKALRAHPEKVNPTDLPRAVRALAERGHNISNIAAALGTTPTRIAHHIGG